jgi:pSer/pThr/pTyr-binding forkhead associated (FHA) protein
MLLLREMQGDRPQKEIEVPLAGNHISFGRADDCTYQIAGSGAVSRIQATLRKVGEFWEIADGSSLRPSSNGISIRGERIDRHELSPGDVITLFDNTDYKVVLEVVTTEEQPIISSEEETVEVPLYNVQQEIIALRGSLESVAEGVTAIARKLGDSDSETNKALKGIGDGMGQIGDGMGQIGDRVDAIEKELTTMIKPQLNAQWIRDNAQDKLIGRTLIGLSAVLIALGSYNYSHGKPETLDRALSILQVVLGGGAVTTMAMRRHEKPKDPSTEPEGSPQWQN